MAVPPLPKIPPQVHEPQVHEPIPGYIKQGSYIQYNPIIPLIDHNGLLMQIFTLHQSNSKDFRYCYWCGRNECSLIAEWEE